MKWSLAEVGFDAYERRARLFPSLIVTLPIIGTMLALKPAALSGGLGKTLGAIAGYVGAFYLLANVARAEGKRIQPKLLTEWGGWPSTILLRHNDKNLDIHTKARYHAALSKLVPGISLPSQQQENVDPEGADAVYRSATNYLLELRRGKEYQLIHDANAEYGFRRNMLGMRRWGISVVLGTTLLLVIVWWLPFRSGLPTFPRILGDLEVRWKLYVLFVANLSALFFWTFYVREAWVHESAFDYAVALFRTLESPRPRSTAERRGD